MNWQEAAASAPKDKMTPGIWKMRVTKILTGKKDGSIFISQSGARQLFVVFEDENGREGVRKYTLSNKAISFFARLLELAGAPLATMNNLEPADFEDGTLARQYLINKAIWGRAYIAESGYLEVAPMTESQARAAGLGPAPNPPPRRSAPPVTAPPSITAPAAQTAADKLYCDDLPF